MKDPLADAFEGKKAVDLITPEQLDKFAKTMGVGLDSAATFLQGIGYAMFNPNLATSKNITELPGLFTEEGRAKTGERLLTGIAEVASQPYFKPGQILTDYESLSPADRARADRMTLLTDPFVLASPFYGGLRKKVQQEVGDTLLAQGMKEGMSSMQPALRLSGGVAGGSAKVFQYTPEAQLILSKGKDLTSKTKPKTKGKSGVSTMTPELSEELLSLYEQGITSPSMLNKLIDGKMSASGISNFLNKNNLKIESTGDFQKRLQPTIDVKNNTVRFPNEQIKNAYIKDLKALSSLERQGIKSDLMYNKQYFKDTYFPFMTNLKSIDKYHDLVRKEFNISKRVIKSDETQRIKSKKRRESISKISDIGIERQLAGDINFNFHHGSSKKFNATTSNTMYVEGSKNRGPIRKTEIEIDKLYDDRENLIRQYVETGVKPEGYVKNLIKINEKGVKLVENPEIKGTLNFKIFDPKSSEFYDYGIDPTKTLEGVFPTGKNIADLSPSEIQMYQDLARKPKVDNFKKGGRVGFQEGTQDITSFDQFGPVPGTITASVNSSVQSLQEQIKNIYKDRIDDSLSAPPSFAELKAEEIQKELQDRLNPPKPVKFKFSQLPKLVTESPILRSFLGDPRVYALETAELFYNGIRPGVENDVEMEKLFPGLYAMHNLATGTGIDPTPKEQTYISMIDELNRAQEKGLANFGYNVVDLALSVPDAVFPTEFTEALKKQYEEMDLAQPETFLGDLGALIIEYGIPGSVGFKLINRFRKIISNKTKGKADNYLFTRKTYGLEGLPKFGVQISNVAKRVGTTSLAFGAADFVAGGPYNTLTEMFDDPLLSDRLVGKLEDVEELSGKERVAANFRNRLRYGAEGAMIGGLFPLVGPALGVLGKNVLLKPALFAGKYGVVYPLNYLAIKPATYLASRDPVVLPGIARGAGAFAGFLGKDVLARLAATAATGGKAFVPSLKGNLGQLPDFQQWRMFDIASNDPLERGLRKVDNFLKWFRDSGNQALYSFNLSGGAERFIKAKAREIEKYLDGIERRAYDLANGFLRRYNNNTTSPAGERHMLEQVYEYLRGNLKLSKLEPELQDLSKSLKTEFDQIKKAFVSELPEGSGLRAFLESNLDKYMRASFSVFTNPRFTPGDDVVERATDFMVNVIGKNEDFIEAAVRGVPVTEQAQAIRAFAKTNVENIIALGRREGIDPIETLKQVNREILRGDDTVIQTGEELPAVIRELLGETKDLRASVMTTAGSLVTQTSNLRSFREIAKHGLENGYLFTSRAEALAAGVTDPRQIGNLPGLGGLQDLATVDKGGPVGLFASRELKQTFEGTGGMLDSLLQNSFYQSLIAYKAGVQTGKTVFSPATQTRNFGSAGFFPLSVGHIGGNASVTDAFKIVLDDIFGAGRVVDESDLIKRISRKIELGVLDENIVASELSAILNDIKAGKLQSLGKLTDRVDNSKLFKTATRVYAGGDNVWKWYGHEFYMSQLKSAFKNFNEVKRYMKDFHGVDISNRNIFGGGAKTLEDGIEEAAAYLLRETYPTYSKVPEFIKAIRKLPIGNFVSFTSEILRTSFANSAIALKHISSDNPVLREMGYRALSGQAITLGGVTAGASALAHAMTNVTPTQLEVYKEYFAPDYMKFSSLIPVSNVENGVFEVFDLSRYHPYDIVTSSARELLRVADRQFHDQRIARLTEELKNVDPGSAEGQRIRQQLADLAITSKMGQTLDPKKITTATLQQYLNAVGPLYNAVTGTFFGIPIGAEAFIEAARGRTFDGSTIWNENMPETEIFDRAMGHFFKTIEPGLISSGRKLLYAARGDVSGVGQPIEINQEIFKLMGGSNVKIDIPGSLDVKIGGDFLASFRDPRMGRGYYSTANYQQRGPEQLVAEYNKQNQDAFRMQYDFYKAVNAAIDSGLLTRQQVVDAMKRRIAPDSKTVPSKIIAFINGIYTPMSYGPEGLKGRREKILRNDPTLNQVKYNFQYFLPFGALEAAKRRWSTTRFTDFERQPEPQASIQDLSPQPTTAPAQIAEPTTPPLPESGQPTVIPQARANLNPLTGLTTTETALLSPGEQAIRQRQRVTGAS